MVKITCLGASGSVTGSSFLLENSKGSKILIDCGLFQGGKQMEKRNWQDWGFDPKEIQSLVLTHAHIDHSGRIPKLIRDGFSGKIITSPPTAELCHIMLLDSAHIQEMDAEWQTRKNIRQGKKAVHPLYTMADAEASLRHLVPLEQNTITPIEEGIRLRLRNAGHILGSSIAELWIDDGDKEVKIVFSGDLGNKNQLIIEDPEEIPAADYLFVESTYGNRLHRTFEDSKKELLEAILHAVSHEEKVIIPAFALERSQEILYLLGEFYRDGSLPDIPVYLDSPLAIKATEIFRNNKKYYDEEARVLVQDGFDPFDMPNLRFTPKTEESIAINERPGSAIIISASGMCTAGRIKHHLKHNLWRPGASIVIVGFQAGGTTGRQIVEGAKRVKIFQEDVAVRAKVFTIGGFSAHADQKGLLEWTSNFAESHPRVFIIHGEPSSSEILAGKIRESFSLDTHIPAWKETLYLEPGAMKAEVEEKEEIPFDPSHHMMTTIADIERELKGLKNRMGKGPGEGKVSEDDLERLKKIQEDLQSLGPQE